MTASPVAKVASRLVRHDLARLDPDPRLQAEVADGVEDRERGPDGARGVVLVRPRDPERGHDRVADELLHRAAVSADAAGRPLEEAVDAPAHDLRVRCGDERGRVDDVDEQHGCELALS